MVESLQSLWEGFVLPLEEPASNPVLVVAILLSTILVAPLLARLAKLPELIGLILAGIVLGPPLLNLVDRDETIVLLGTVGLLYIMLRAGLEMDLNGFNRYRGRSLSFGFVSFMIPQVLGAIGAWGLLGLSWPAAILLGSMFGSHTLLAYPIASRLGLASNAAVTTVLGGSLITDASALIVLAVVAGMTTGDVGADFWIGLGAAGFLLVAGALLILPRLGRLFFSTVEGDGTPQFLFILAAVFLTAWFAELGGFAPIIGAFLGGLALNRLVPANSPLMSRIEFVGTSLFIPIFLVSVGMLVDVRLLLRGEGLDVAALMCAGVLIGKSAAAFLAAKGFKYSRDEAWAMFGLSAPQAAATLAAVFVGFEIGLFDEAIINGTVAMILVTCLIGPSLVEKYGRRIVLQQEAAPLDSTERPQRVLVPLANPATTASLISLAMMVRRRTSDQALYPLTVASGDGSVETHVAASERLLATAVRQAASANVPVIPITRVDLNIANGIQRALTELRISSVIIGWNGQITTRDRIFGSVLDQVLHQTHQTLMVCKLDKPLSTYKRVVVAVAPLLERDPHFFAAWQDVKIMAEQMGTSLLLVGQASTLDALLPASKQIKPNVPEKAHVIEDFRKLHSELPGLLQKTDLFVGCLARRDTMAYSPYLERVPRNVARALPESSFLFVYPPDERSDDQGPEGTTNDSLRRGLMSELEIYPEELAGGLDEAIPRLLALAFEDDGSAPTGLVDRALASRPDTSFEVAPGTVLLEVHAHESPSWQLVIAPVVHDVLLKGEETPETRSVVLLVSSGDEASRTHLARFSAMSEHLHQLPSHALRGISSREDACAMLRGVAFVPPGLDTSALDGPIEADDPAEPSTEELPE